MKWRLECRSLWRRWIITGIVFLAGICFIARAELARWVEDVEASGKLEAVFFRSVSMPGGAIPVRRPAKETRPELAKLIAAAPSEAELYSLRALEAEQQLDFAAAEADWNKYVDLAADKGAARLALADFYHRRLQPREEFATLGLAAREANPPSEKLLAADGQRSWKTYERIFALIDEQKLPAESGIGQFGQWTLRYPNEPVVYQRYVDYLVAHKLAGLAPNVIAQYRRQFPQDSVFPVRAEAQVQQSIGAVDAALAIYDRQFRPLWPPELVKSYFDLLRETGSLRKFLAQARAAVAANPADLNAAARLFYYWQQQGNLAEAQRALVEIRQRREKAQPAWSAEDLFTLAQLFEGAHNYDEAARCYYAEWSAAGNGGDAGEKALAAIARLLLAAPEQPVRFGVGDLSFYRDVATMDPYPGFLNGVLSLILNTTQPEQRYSFENQAATAYFHRAKAAELIAFLDSRYPNSSECPDLHALLIEAYATYGDADGVIRNGREFMTAFPSAPQRTQVALRMGDAYATKSQGTEEFALYDALLRELAAKSDGVPLGEAASVRPAPPSEPQDEPQETPVPRRPQRVVPPVRSPEYARVLDRYISRLLSLQRVRDALALYRREIDRNPNDPGLYERLASFLEQNRMGADVEQVYRRAMEQFQGRSWSEKLARWYLRQRQTAQFEQLTQQVVKVFAGTDLEAYFRDVVAHGSLAPALYLRVNLYAHQRFPHNLAFVRNLLTAYTTRGTADPAAYEALLRQNWFYDAALRSQFFERLSRTGRLDSELTALKAASPGAASGRWTEVADANPAAARLFAEGEAWRSHFETAAPALLAVSEEYPAEPVIGERTASVYRSLAAFDPANTAVASRVEQTLGRAEPRNHGFLTRIGEIYADREQYDKARPFWNHIAEVEPGRPDGYLEAATVFWDYYLYDDALRLINDGRQKTGNSSLDAYQVGAIYENKRDYEAAIREYAKGAIYQGQGSAQARLLILAKRPSLRPYIEQLTDNMVSARNPDPPAFDLRVELLHNQNRRADVEKLLLELADRTTSVDLAIRVENTGRIDGFPNVQEKALQRQIALTTDPVDRMRLRLDLARFYESQGKVADGSRVIEELLRENPAVLGVVRAATDYYWRNKESKRAVDVLVDSASKAQTDYWKQFTLEAARKSTDSGDYDRARILAASLIGKDPFNAEYLAAMADTYARQGDDAGLRTFYTGKIREMGKAPLASEEKTQRVAAMRRGLIPVLTRMKDYPGALDQYIEVLNKFSDDEGLAREAAAYAASHNGREKLLAYYRKASADSPKDSRWPIVMARLQTQFEDFPAAVGAYDRSIQIRPDRVDLYVAKAGLEQRLLRFDEAAQSYTKLYDLTYRTSFWMEKVAEVRARQGQANAAVAALRKVWIEGQPDRAANYLDVAQRLESLGLMSEARQYAEEAVRRAGNQDGLAGAAQLYARILMRQREWEAVWTKLGGGAQPANRAALIAAGEVAASYFTPEEKAAFAAFLERQWPNQSPELRQQALLPLVQRAGLTDLQARWLNEWLLAHAAEPASQYRLRELIALQKRRLKFAELAGQLEAYWKASPPDTANRDAVLIDAADAYRSADDTAAELRVLAQKEQLSGLTREQTQRYAALLQRQPQQYVAAVAGGYSEQLQNWLVESAISRGNLRLALNSVAARGRKLPPVWTRSYTALTGLYYASASPQVQTAFRQALGLATVGERVARHADRDQQLAGDVWFYYGSRYGEYLSAIKQPGAEDFLPAGLEGTPARSGAYFQLAEYYRESGDRPRALADYQNTLQLSPKRVDAHDRIAVVHADDGKQPEAVAEWKLAIESLSRQQDGVSVPPSFWSDVEDTLTHIGLHQALAPLRDDIDRLLKTYIRRNGAYQAAPLMRGVLAATSDAPAGVEWMLELSRSAAEPARFLAAIVNEPWIPEAQRDVLYQRIVESAQAKQSQVFGQARESASYETLNWQIERLRYLVDQKQNDKAQQVLNSIPENQRKTRVGELAPLEVRIAARTRMLDALLARWQRAPDQAPASGFLRRAAAELRKDGDPVSARRVLEFIYSGELVQNNFEAANFLGLAEVRLEEKDVAGAVSLLRRMTLIAGQPFETLAPAASLLIRTGHAAQAVEFLTTRVKATPWDWEARELLAGLQQNAGALASIAQAKECPYETRVAAALAIRKAKAAAAPAGSAELDLLAGQAVINDAAASQPYFYQARVEAAKASSVPATRISLLEAALAIDPAPDAPRLSLFRTALAARRYQLAVSTFDRVLPEYFRGDVETEPQEYLVGQFLRGSDFGLNDRVAVARGLGDAYQRLDDLGHARLYYGVAQKLLPSAVVKQSLDAVQAALDLEAKNAQRRPVVTQNLEQEHLVRPRGGAR